MPNNVNRKHNASAASADGAACEHANNGLFIHRGTTCAALVINIFSQKKDSSRKAAKKSPLPVDGWWWLDGLV